MKLHTLYNYDKDTYTSSAILTDSKGRTFIGIAVAAPDDYDFASEKTGLTIAYTRAKIKALSANIQDLRLQLNALQHLKSCIITSKKYNEKSYENKMLNRTIIHTQKSINYLKSIKEEQYEHLRKYIIEKDKFYKQLRARRNKGKDK